MRISGLVKWQLRLTVVMVLMAIGLLVARSGTPATNSLLVAKPAGDGVDTHADAMAQADAALHAAVTRAEAQPDSWLAHEYAALAFHQRAQLSESFSDLVSADGLLERAWSRPIPEGSGPLISSAIVDFSFHRNADAKKHLDSAAAAAVPRKRAQRAQIEAMRGDIALYDGDYPAAEQHYRSAFAIEPDPGVAIRLANYHQRMGDFDTAIQTLENAQASFARPSPRLLSLYLLYAGGMELKRGRWDEARQYFERADRVFAGSWLTSAHIAQLDAAEGNFEAASRRYREILRYHEEPSVMAAYAALLEKSGDRQGGARMSARADSILQRRAAIAPEAFADHLLDGALSRGDYDAALAHARFNHANRPYGDAKVGLARALNALDRYDDARQVLMDVEASGWRSTEQYLALAKACTGLGNKACVRKAEQKAQAFNSKAKHPRADLLAFGNH